MVKFRNYCMHLSFRFQHERLKFEDIYCDYRNTNIYERFQNSSSYYCDTHPVAKFAIIKTSK